MQISKSRGMPYDDKHKTNKCKGYVKDGRKLVRDSLAEKVVLRKCIGGGK